MVHAITRRNAYLYQDELEQCYRLRHEVFVEESGWEDIRRPDGREIDQFDTEDAVHLAALRGGKVAAYVRLLSTLKPHLLSEVYPQLCQVGPIPRGHDIVELTRYCVAPNFRSGRSFNEAGAALMAGMLEYCLMNGIRQISGEGHPIWVTRYLELGFDVSPLGLPQDYKGNLVVAMLAKIDEGTLIRTRAAGGIGPSVLRDRLEFPDGIDSEEIVVA